LKLKELYSLVDEFKVPHLLITLTMNDKWKIIQEMLGEKISCLDDPVLMTEIFNSMYSSILSSIVGKLERNTSKRIGIFGNVVAY
jgi:hypothetical protein